jgi:hypothetical protein
MDLIFGEQRREYRIQTHQKIYFAGGPSTPVRARQASPARPLDARTGERRLNGGRQAASRRPAGALFSCLSSKIGMQPSLHLRLFDRLTSHARQG